MEEESWRRNLGEGFMEEESWMRHHGGGGIMQEESWRRNHGGGILEKRSWRKHHGGGIMKESWNRNHGGGIMEEASGRQLEFSGKPLGGIWEASERLLGASVGHGSSRASWSRNVQNSLCFTAFELATPYFVSTGREQVSESVVKTDTFARAFCEHRR